VADSFPAAPLHYVDTLWLQVGGTLCNLACTHCFISCSPTNRTHEMMSLAQVRTLLDEAEGLGVRDFGVTGGEPFANREIFEIVEAIAARGPLLILTNGMLVTEARADRLGRIARDSDYSIDVRVSLDAADEAANDAVRGAGCFRQATAGIRALAAHGIEPSVAVTRVDESATNERILAAFGALLAELGVRRPRVKIFEPFRIGAEASRTQGYGDEDRVTHEMASELSLDRLQCTTSRTATERGVWVCPILVNEPRGRMGATIAETLRPFPLYSGACHTCLLYGVSCRV
jgi:MoaA/NifB/PqqE/SkfB family radical SAM enzyme